MVWQKNGTPDTLGSAGPDIQITDLTNNKNNQFLAHTFPSTTTAQDWTFNGSTAGVYASRDSNDGGLEGTAITTTSVDLRLNTNEDYFHVIYNTWVTGEEKLSIGFNVGNNIAGENNIPSRYEGVFKYVPSPDEILSQAKLNKGAFTNFATNSNLSALSDVVEAPITVGGWVELGRTTLGIASATISVASLADKRYYMVLNSSLGTIVNTDNYIQMNSDTGTNYANRFSFNGTESTQVSQVRNSVNITSTASNTPFFAVNYYSNFSGNEKLGTGNSVQQLTAGAGTSPQRSENATKWVNTSVAIDEFTLINGGASNYAIGSEIVVLGWDPTDTHTTNFWEELFSEKLTSNLQEFDTGTITAKKYLWLQFYQVGHTGNSILTFNADTGSNYARRHSINGAGDVTVVGQTGLLNVLTGGTGDNQTLTNMFIINNSANEKLMTFMTTFDTASGFGTAPQKILGVCKWDNTAAQITRIQVEDNTGTGFNAPSFLKIWGSD